MSDVLYTELINEIYSKQKGLNNSSNKLTKNKVFSEFFSNDNQFKDKFYNYFGISGASLMIADSLKRKIILLQEGFDDANNLPKLEMPVGKNIESPSTIVPELNSLSDSEYNFLVNRIFQIQRKSEEYWGDSNVPIYTNVPEFDLFRDKNGEFYSGSVSRLKLLKSFLIWRFLIWKINNSTSEVSYSDLLNFADKTLYIRSHRKGKYFSTHNIRSKFKHHLSLPEWSVDDLSESDVWKGNVKLHKIWEELSNKVDSKNKSFLDEIGIINDLTSKEIFQDLCSEYGITASPTDDKITIDVFKKVLQEFLQSAVPDKAYSIPKLLEILHKSIPMLIPYYYFSIIDRRVKSHFAFSIWKAPELAFEYYDQHNQLKRESSIFNCVVSLNIDIDSTKQQELKTAIKLITENVINDVVIGQSIRAEQRNDRHQFERTILLSKINNQKGLFVLGLNEERITFVAQQSRALNLIRALSELDILNKEKSLAIIGGGVSGINAASASYISGIKDVTIFEKSDDILSLQSDAFHREIHPNIYDWPNTLYDHKESNFPFLNWTADNAPNVLSQIESKFNKIKANSNKTINVLTNTTVSQIDSVSQNRFEIKSSKKSLGVFDIVIVAIGHGIERVINGLNYSNHSTYWKNDGLDRLSEEKEVQVLVSGSGDGALIDIVRSKLKIDHNQIFELTNRKEFRKLGFEMLKVDRGFIRDSYLKTSSSPLFERYKKIPEILKAALECSELLREFIKPNVVVSHFTRSQKLKLETSLINRMFVFLLHTDENIEVDFLKWTDIVKCSCEKINGEYRYIVSHKTISKGEVIEESEDEFSKVFFRHGTNIIDHYNNLGLLNEFSLKSFLSPDTITNDTTAQAFKKKLSSVGVTFFPDKDDFIVSETLTNNSETFRLNLTNYLTKDTSKWYEDCIYNKKLDFLYDDIK